MKIFNVLWERKTGIAAAGGKFAVIGGHKCKVPAERMTEKFVNQSESIKCDSASKSDLYIPYQKFVFETQILRYFAK